MSVCCACVLVVVCLSSLVRVCPSLASCCPATVSSSYALAVIIYIERESGYTHGYHSRGCILCSAARQTYMYPLGTLLIFSSHRVSETATIHNS